MGFLRLASRGGGAVAALALATVGPGWSSAPAADAAAPSAHTRLTAHAARAPRLLWRDQFAGARNAAPDPASWRSVEGATFNGGRDHVAYTRRPENVSLDGRGHLRIVVRRERYQIGGVTRDYTSGRVNTAELREFRPPFRLEARIKVPAAKGIVPALWLLGASYGPWGEGPVTWPDAGETDVLELPGGNQVQHGIHGPSAASPLDRRPNREVSVEGRFKARTRLDRGFHVYGVDVLRNRLRFRLDGAVRDVVTRRRFEAAGGRWAGVFDKPQYVVLNVAALSAWVGEPVFSGSRSMLVDWIRVTAP